MAIRRAVIFDTGPGTDKALGLAGAGRGAVAFFLVGWLGALSLAALACEASSLYCAFVTGYRCGMCDQRTPSPILAPEERRRVGRQQTLVIFVAIGLAVVGLGSLWLFLFRNQ